MDILATVSDGSVDGRFYAAITFLATPVKGVHMGYKARTEVRTNPSWSPTLL